MRILALEVYRMERIQEIHFVPNPVVASMSKRNHQFDHYIKGFRKAHLKDVVIQVVLLGVKDQFLYNNDVINDASTFNEGRLNVVYQGINHMT